MIVNPGRDGRYALAGRRGAFTLIELLTVIAIISLLMAILLPSLSHARIQAKNAKTRASLKSIGDGLEMFRAENESEAACHKTGGYPSSAASDDPTEEGQQNIFGAQWLVRYLLGKDVKGFVPKRNVPPDVIALGGDPDDGYSQKHWYDTPADSYVSDVGRVGPYIQPDGLKLVETGKLPGKHFGYIEPPVLKQLVAVDTFDFPILYYAANVRRAERGNAPLASYDGSNPGVYTMTDNGLFTGACLADICTYPPWDFAGVIPAGGSDTQGYYKLSQFGENDPPDPNSVASARYTFPYYILNQNVYESSDKKTANPHRKDSYLLITAGRDGNFGTADDVTNF